MRSDSVQNVYPTKLIIEKGYVQESQKYNEGKTQALDQEATPRDRI